MPYYSYGYGYDSANLVYLILLVPVLLLSLYAQAAVSGNFSRYSKVTNRRGLTGAQAAASVLRAHGITDVGIARCSGKLTTTTIRAITPSFSPIRFTMPPRSRRSALPRMRRDTRCSTPWAMALSSCAAPL